MGAAGVSEVAGLALSSGATETSEVDGVYWVVELN